MYVCMNEAEVMAVHLYVCANVYLAYACLFVYVCMWTCVRMHICAYEAEVTRTGGPMLVMGLLFDLVGLHCTVTNRRRVKYTPLGRERVGLPEPNPQSHIRHLMLGEKEY